MIVNEKGLLRAMKAAYKAMGYNVAAELQSGIENIFLTTGVWGVIIEKKNVPRKVLGLIAEHVGDIPEDGEAFQVKNKEPQTELFTIATQLIRGIHAGDKPLRTVKKTPLMLGGYQLWQRKEDLKIFKVNPALEDILLTRRGTVRIVGDEMLMLDDLESRAYISVERPDENEQKMLEHLSQVQWVAM